MRFNPDMLPQGSMYPVNPEMAEDAPLIDAAMDVRQRSLSRGPQEDLPETAYPKPPSEFQVPFMNRRCLAILFFFVVSNVLYLAALSLTSGPKVEPSLRKVFLVFRHGSRAPGFTYKNDHYIKDNKKYWPNGPGELTAAGKVEAYELGKRLRERYGGFIGDYYNVKQFRAYSTLIERTMMSAQLVLASLFPPTGYQDWNNQLNWQPVPVYPNGIVNATSGCSCPRFALEFKNSVKNLMPSELGFDTEVGKVLKENAGESDVLPISLFTRVWDAVYFQDRAGLPIPDWIKPIYPEKMVASALKYLKFYLAGSKTQELLVIDPFGRAITTFFRDSPRKMEIHSLHDIHITSLFLLLGIESNTFPEPGSAVAIELHEKESTQNFEVFYYPTPNDKYPIKMKMPCGMSCPISELIKRCKAFEVENYDDLCKDGEGGVQSHILEFKLHF